MDNVAGSGPSELLRMVRLRTSIRQAAVRMLGEMDHAAVLGDPGQSGAPRTIVMGPDPVRVLVFGAGTAIGYGVRRRSDAFDGPLAALIGGRLGRGVVVENRAVEHLRVSATVASLGATKTHTYDLAIWCPSFVEALEQLRTRVWRNELHSMIRQLRSSEVVPLLLTHMPVPVGRHPMALIARPWVQRLNHMIDQVAGEHDLVATSSTEPFVVRDIGPPVTGPDYFRSLATRLSSPALELLDGARHPFRTV